MAPPKATPKTRLLGIVEAAAYLGVSRRTVYRLLDTRTLQRVELAGTRRVLLDIGDLDALVRESKNCVH